MKKNIIIIGLCIVSIVQASDKTDSSWRSLSRYFIADDDVQMVQLLKENPELLSGGLFSSVISQKKNKIAKALLDLPDTYQRLDGFSFFNGLVCAVQCNEELVEPLLERGASCWASEVLPYAQSAAAVTALIDYGADAMCADPNGWTALHHAVYKGMYDVVEALLPYSDIHATTSLRSTPLDFAQTEPIKKLLLEAGAEE